MKRMVSPQPSAAVGLQLGRYTLVRELGRGGMGVVYLARDENLERLVALKTTQIAALGTSERMRMQRRTRFVREVQALAQLSHENVVHVYDAGEIDHPDIGWVLFYAMQHVEGITLAHLVQRRGALPPSAAAAVCMQVAAGLGAAHARGVIHRDVKPANVFLSVEGRALIGDFGIAKLEGATQITRQDQRVGTPNYLAPEQIVGDEVTPATDVFALGALFYVIATNRPLRARLDAASLLEHARGESARGKMWAETQIPAPLRSVVGRALERDPARRFPDAAAFAEALAEFAGRMPTLETDAAAASAAGARPAHEAGGSTSDEQAMQRAQVNAAAAAMLADVSAPSPAARPTPAAQVHPSPLRARTQATGVYNLRALPAAPVDEGPLHALPELVPLPHAPEPSALLPRARSWSERRFLLSRALERLEHPGDEA